MKWGEFKKLVENAGVKDATEVKIISYSDHYGWRGSDKYYVQKHSYNDAVDIVERGEETEYYRGPDDGR